MSHPRAFPLLSLLPLLPLAALAGCDAGPAPTGPDAPEPAVLPLAEGRGRLEVARLDGQTVLSTFDERGRLNTVVEYRDARRATLRTVLPSGRAVLVHWRGGTGEPGERIELVGPASPGSGTPAAPAQSYFCDCSREEAEVWSAVAHYMVELTAMMAVCGFASSQAGMNVPVTAACFAAIAAVSVAYVEYVYALDAWDACRDRCRIFGDPRFFRMERGGFGTQLPGRSA